MKKLSGNYFTIALFSEDVLRTFGQSNIFHFATLFALWKPLYMLSAKHWHRLSTQQEPWHFEILGKPLLSVNVWRVILLHLFTLITLVYSYYSCLLLLLLFTLVRNNDSTEHPHLYASTLSWLTLSTAWFPGEDLTHLIHTGDNHRLQGSGRLQWDCRDCVPAERRGSWQRSHSPGVTAIAEQQPILAVTATTHLTARLLQFQVHRLLLTTPHPS